MAHGCRAEQAFRGNPSEAIYKTKADILRHVCNRFTTNYILFVSSSITTKLSAPLGCTLARLCLKRRLLAHVWCLSASKPSLHYGMAPLSDRDCRLQRCKILCHYSISALRLNFDISFYHKSVSPTRLLYLIIYSAAKNMSTSGNDIVGLSPGPIYIVIALQTPLQRCLCYTLTLHTSVD